MGFLFDLSKRIIFLLRTEDQFLDFQLLAFQLEDHMRLI
jgi:hypothetical protein